MQNLAVKKNTFTNLIGQYFKECLQLLISDSNGMGVCRQGITQNIIQSLNSEDASNHTNID